jgi:hypothetical protein
LDAPIALAREELQACAAYGTPGYGSKSKGASVSPPSSGSKKLLGLDLYAGAGMSTSEYFYKSLKYC